MKISWDDSSQLLGKIIQMFETTNQSHMFPYDVIVNPPAKFGRSSPFHALILGGSSHLVSEL